MNRDEISFMGSLQEDFKQDTKRTQKRDANFIIYLPPIAAAW